MANPGVASDREILLGTAKLFGMVSSSWMSQATSVAAELRIADLLAGGPKDVDALARSTGCQAPSLRRLMRALASLDLCTELDDDFFELRPLGSLLRADAPDSLRSWTIWWGKHLWPVWGNLLHSVRTGESNKGLLTGTADGGFLGRDAEASAAFDHAMAEITRVVSREVVRVYDFSGIERIVDVGGGYAGLLSAILDAHPRAQGILFDLPYAIEGATRLLGRAGLLERCVPVAGNFFDSVPGGGDVYLLKSVLHDWSDERSAVILRNCRSAMPEHARLLLVERIMPARMKPSPEDQVMAWSDLNMLVVPGGRERTAAEFRGLLASAGLEVARILPAAQGFSVIESIPCALQREPTGALTMRHGEAVAIPSQLPPLSGTKERGPLAVSTGRVASYARTLIASDHLALRLASSAALLGSCALAVWWAVGVIAAL